MTLSITNAVVSFVGALVLHEFGHYLAARICRVPIKQAGFGWGPKLFRVRVRNVDYQLRLLPIGAYIQLDMIELQQRALWQQLFVLGAGIGMDITLAGLSSGRCR